MTPSRPLHHGRGHRRGPEQGLRRPPLTDGGGPVAQAARSAHHYLLLLLGARTPLLMPMPPALQTASEMCTRT